jgi:hypothetical protein
MCLCCSLYVVLQASFVSGSGSSTVTATVCYLEIHCNHYAINYIIIVIICINNNNNNLIINNNCGKLQDIILLFRIPTGTRKHFFEIYKQFGHTPSKRFASPNLRHMPNVQEESYVKYGVVSKWVRNRRPAGSDFRSNTLSYVESFVTS